MSDVMLALVMTSCQPVVRAEDSLEDRFRAAMKEASNHWMVLDRDVQFRGAIGAVYSAASEPEKARIDVELKAMKALNALLSGVPINFDALELPPDEERLGLIRMWQEVIA